MVLKKQLGLYAVVLSVVVLAFIAFVNMNTVSTGVRVQEGQVSEPLDAEMGPKIVFNDTELHLGKVFSGDKATAEFVFKNLGSETLVIERVRAG
jgi:hypothetical protein